MLHQSKYNVFEGQKPFLDFDGGIPTATVAGGVAATAFRPWIPRGAFAHCEALAGRDPEDVDLHCKRHNGVP